MEKVTKQQQTCVMALKKYFASVTDFSVKQQCSVCETAVQCEYPNNRLAFSVDFMLEVELKNLCADWCWGPRFKDCSLVKSWID